MSEREKAIKAIEVTLASLDPKKPLRFKKEDIEAARYEAIEGLNIALRLLEVSR